MNHRVVIVGAAGRMGRAIVRGLHAGRVEGLILSAAVDHAHCPDMGQDIGSLSGLLPLGIPLTSNLPAALEQADLLIDFSFHTASATLAGLMATHKIPWVIGTTGFTRAETSHIETAARAIPIVMAPNMSVGVNLLFALVQETARALKQKGYDVEIIERHHRRKTDSPSGTALGLGQAVAAGMDWDLQKVSIHGREGIIQGERPEEQIGFHAVRGGDIIGDHTVLFATDGECIELSHRATSRDTFALGALRAALWVHGRAPGLYSMQDVLGLHARP